MKFSLGHHTCPWMYILFLWCSKPCLETCPSSCGPSLTTPTRNMALPTGIISFSFLAFFLPPTESSEKIPIGEEGAQQNSAHPVGGQTHRMGTSWGSGRMWISTAHPGPSLRVDSVLGVLFTEDRATVWHRILNRNSLNTNNPGDKPRNNTFPGRV